MLCQAKLTFCLVYIFVVVNLVHILLLCVHKPRRETETELLPAMDTLSVGRGAESGLVKRKISESSISSDMLSESHRGDALAFLPPPSEWEQWPVLFRISPIGIPNVSRLDCSDPFAPIRINDNVSVPFETPLFCGRVIIRMAGLPNAEDYFHGRKRLTNLVIQGQFRRPVAFYSLLTGQKFSTEVNALPRGLARVMAGIIKKLQPTVEINLLAKSPFWVSATFLFCLLFFFLFYLLTFTSSSLSLFLCFSCTLYISPRMVNTPPIS